MVNPNRFYTYAYLREDRTPYYIGKGTGYRIYQNTGKSCNKPKDKSRIIFLKQNLTEEDAFKHEIYMITVFGRKDLGTGILHNRTNGGEGVSGYILSKQQRKERSLSRKGQIAWNKGMKGVITLSEETKKKMSISHKGQTPWNKGIKYDEEKRAFMEKISKMPKPSHHGKNVSKSMKGNPNIINARKKHYAITFNDGRVEYVFGIVEWCKMNGYNDRGLYRFISGERKKYKDIRTVEKLGPLKCISNVITTETPAS
jgi:hypothetical protein